MKLGEGFNRLHQEFRTGKLFVGNLKHHSPNVEVATDYWDKAPIHAFNHLVEKLGEPNNPERFAIRHILSSFEVGSVLDAGCGPAAEYESYRHNGFMKDARYVGIDGSQRMLTVAEQKYPGVTLVQGDLQQLPVATKSFDAVVLKHILEHQPEGYEKVVAEAVRVARKCVVINFFHPPLPLIPKILQLKNKKGYADNWYNKKCFEDYLRTLPIQGWQVVHARGSAGQRSAIYAIGI